MLTNTFATAALVALSTVGMAAAMPPSDPGEDARRSASQPPSRTADRVPVAARGAFGVAAAPAAANDLTALVPSLTASVDDVVEEFRRDAGETSYRPDPVTELRLIADQAALATDATDLATDATDLVADQADLVAHETDLAADEPVYLGADGEAIDAQRLRVWLEDRDSPMADHVEVLVAEGIEHDVDPRLVVAIATKESSAGIHLPPGSHNAWGWGGSGAHGLAAWPSWPAAIAHFTERLGALYDTDNVDAQMAERYCPPNARDWLETVRWVIQDI